MNIRRIKNVLNNIEPLLKNNNLIEFLCEVGEIEELKLLVKFGNSKNSKNYRKFLKRYNVPTNKIDYLSKRWEKLFKNRISTSKAMSYIENRDGKRCIYCKGLNNLQVHHVIPQAIGGPDSIWNYVLACEKCNKAILQNIKLPYNWFLLHEESVFSKYIKNKG